MSIIRITADTGTSMQDLLVLLLEYPSDEVLIIA